MDEEVLRRVGRLRALRRRTPVLPSVRCAPRALRDFKLTSGLGGAGKGHSADDCKARVSRKRRETAQAQDHEFLTDYRGDKGEYS